MTSTAGTSAPHVPSYVEQLAGYLERQRWFSGKGRRFTVEHVQRLPWLPSAADAADSHVRIELVTVRFADGSVDTYQFPTAYLIDPDPDLGHAYVGTLHDEELGDVSSYDAVHVKPATEALLRGFLEHWQDDGLAFCVLPDTELPTDAVGSLMTAEQSNTSVAYGDDAILKLFRRIGDGHNPDIEIHNALTRDGCEHVAPLLGWLEGRWSDGEGEPHQADLAMLQVFLRTAADGWSLALASVRDLFVEEDLHPDEVGGDFAAESERLGEATALVHVELARSFSTDSLGAEAVGEIVDGMRARLDRALAEVPELAEFEAGLRRRFDSVAAGSVPVPVQRVHGDLHLGQTLRTVKNWKLIDFEGEPVKSLAERVKLDSPLRDVAGMIRSYAYAAGSGLLGFGSTAQLTYRAEEWTARNQQAFLDGYSAASGAELDPADPLLLAYEADKAVYEAVYEARNRPTWLPIPLRAIGRIAAGD